MDSNRIARFEERVQALVEGSFARLFAGRLGARDVAQRLARVMENDARSDADGHRVAPNHYAVHLAPPDCAALLEARPDLAAALAEHLLVLALESGFRLDALPEVQFVADESVGPQSILVRTGHGAPARQTTQAMTALDAAPAAKDIPLRLPQAFLVIDGDRFVPLDRSVITIGRRRDNAIVVDDSRVSRQHCQVRYRVGQFVLYDLGSRGGTFVNQVRVSECVLRPGDVISLAGVPVVYVVEDGTTGRSGGDTQVRLARTDLEPE